MNSKERHEARYQRRKLKREIKKKQISEQFDNFDNVFTFDNLYKSSKKCYLGVGWKASTQRYKTNALLNVNNTLNLLKQNKYKSCGFYEFDIIERGKARHIQSVHISERVVQRCLCDYSLVPMFSRSFIYDNCACLKNKGIDFAINRLKKHLREHCQKYGTNGYVLIFDFSKYFNNINHDKLKAIIDKYYTDTRLKNLLAHFIDNFGDIGLGLGSQISQICALMYPNKLDHYIKEVLKIKGYGRYMDDGYLIHKDKQYLKFCLNQINRICNELDIKLNPKKTQIVKLSRGINFLKRRFIITNTGKILQIPNRKGIVKMRHKLKTFKHWLDIGKMQLADIKTSYISWQGHIKHCNAYNTLKNTNKIFKKLFTEV